MLTSAICWGLHWTISRGYGRAGAGVIRTVGEESSMSVVAASASAFVGLDRRSDAGPWRGNRLTAVPARRRRGESGSKEGPSLRRPFSHYVRHVDPGGGALRDHA